MIGDLRFTSRRGECRQECPMPRGIDHHHHPGGVADNSPTFQRWGCAFRGAQVPKGRLKSGAIRQPSLRDLSDCGGGFPTLKRWAIIVCPSRTMIWLGFARELWVRFCEASLGANPGGMGHFHPGGMADNSPTFQRWGCAFRGAQVPKGRLKSGALRQPSLRDLWDCGGGFPTLKRWAIIVCPSGTMIWLASALCNPKGIVSSNPALAVPEKAA